MDSVHTNFSRRSHPRHPDFFLRSRMSRSSHFGPTSGRLQANLGSTLGPTLGQLWANFGPTWVDFGWTLGGLWVDFGPTLRQLWVNLGPMLGRLWADSGPIPKPFRGDSELPTVNRQQNRRSHISISSVVATAMAWPNRFEVMGMGSPVS